MFTVAKMTGFSLKELIGVRVWLEGAYESPDLAGVIVKPVSALEASDREQAIARNKFLVRLDDGRSFTFAGAEFFRVEGKS